MYVWLQKFSKSFAVPASVTKEGDQRRCLGRFCGDELEHIVDVAAAWIRGDYRAGRIAACLPLATIRSLDSPLEHGLEAFRRGEGHLSIGNSDETRELRNGSISHKS